MIMHSHQPQSLSRYFVSSVISYALVMLLCAPFASLGAVSYKGDARAESKTATNVPAVLTQGKQRSGELIDVNAFVRPSFGDRWKPKSDRFMNHASTLKASVNKSFHYGMDKDNVPFAQRPDGTKGRFVNLSPNHFRLQITKGKRRGEVEFIRLSDAETLTKFKTGGGYNLLVRTRKQTADGGKSGINIGFQYRNERVTLKLKEESAEKGFAPDAEKKLRRMLADVGKNRVLRELMEDTRSFSDKSVLSGVTSAIGNSYAVEDSLECILNQTL